MRPPNRVKGNTVSEPKLCGTYTNTYPIQHNMNTRDEYLDLKTLHRAFRWTKSIPADALRQDDFAEAATLLEYYEQEGAVPVEEIEALLPATWRTSGAVLPGGLCTAETAAGGGTLENAVARPSSTWEHGLRRPVRPTAVQVPETHGQDGHLLLGRIIRAENLARENPAAVLGLSTAAAECFGGESDEEFYEAFYQAYLHQETTRGECLSTVELARLLSNGPVSPGVKSHLKVCAKCRLDYETLLYGAGEEERGPRGPVRPRRREPALATPAFREALVAAPAEEAKTPAAPAKRRRAALLNAALLLVGILAGCGYFCLPHDVREPIAPSPDSMPAESGPHETAPPMAGQDRNAEEPSDEKEPAPEIDLKWFRDSQQAVMISTYFHSTGRVTQYGRTGATVHASYANESDEDDHGEEENP